MNDMKGKEQEQNTGEYTFSEAAYRKLDEVEQMFKKKGDDSVSLGLEYETRKEIIDGEEITVVDEYVVKRRISDLEDDQPLLIPVEP